MKTKKQQNYEAAIAHLVANGVDIDSITEKHTIEAVFIASGLKIITDEKETE